MFFFTAFIALNANLTLSLKLTANLTFLAIFSGDTSTRVLFTDLTPLKIVLAQKLHPRNPQISKLNPYKAGNDSVTCELDKSGTCESGEKCCYDTGSGSSNGTDTFAGCCPETATLVERPSCSLQKHWDLFCPHPSPRPLLCFL